MSGYSDKTGQDWHVIPMNDLRPHKSGKDCWCKPSRDADEHNVWVHHSLDRREHTIEKGITQ